MHHKGPIPVTGATGYIGGRLVPRLLEAGYVPKGLAGLLYWYLLYPFHSIIFSGLCKKISQKAEDLKPGRRLIS